MESLTLKLDSSLDKLATVFCFIFKSSGMFHKCLLRTVSITRRSQNLYLCAEITTSVVQWFGIFLSVSPRAVVAFTFCHMRI